MPAEHYFTDTPDGELRPRRITVRLAGRDVELTTAGGVFSPAHVDLGTKVLLGEVPAPPVTGDLLDLGCGWGPIALSLALESPEARVWAVDVNERALELVRRNAAELGITTINAVRPEDVPDDVRFATLWSNPPIRIGKPALHEIMTDWLPRIEHGADGYLVVQRNLGADSLQRWIDDELSAVVSTERMTVSKGFRVLRIQRLPA